MPKTIGPMGEDEYGPIPRCACRAHADGCPNAATRNSEDFEAFEPCADCAPYEAIGIHASEYSGINYSHDEREELASDFMLMRDEFHGRHAYECE